MRRMYLSSRNYKIWKMYSWVIIWMGDFTCFKLVVHYVGSQTFNYFEAFRTYLGTNLGLPEPEPVQSESL